MNEMAWMALLLGAFAGFMLGGMVASPRIGYQGAHWWGDGETSEVRSYVQDVLLGVVGAIIGLIIAALIVL